MGIKHAYTATGTNDGTKQVSVNRWNEDHAVDTLDLPDLLGSVSGTPDSGEVRLSGRSIGGRMMLMQTGPSGLDTSFQPNLGGNKVALWMPPGGSTTVPGVFGMAALTATGTATTRAIATTNLLTRMTRLGFVSAATAGSLAGAREALAKYTTGAGAGLGGFFMRVRFGCSDAAAVSGARQFVGLWSSTGAPTNVEPNTLTNAIGVVQQSGSTNLQMYCAGAAAGANLVDLGANFPSVSGSVDAYELNLFAASGGGSVKWQVNRLGTAFSASGEFTSGLPLSTVLLAIQAWRTNNATALAVGLDICGIYVETDY